MSDSAGFKCLSASEAELVAALGETILPEEGASLAGARTVHLAERMDDFMAKLPIREQLLVRSMFRLFQAQLAMSHGVSLDTFIHASPDERQRYLSEWEGSSFYPARFAFNSLRAIFLINYVGHPTVQAQIDIRPAAHELDAYLSPSTSEGELVPADQEAVAQP